MSEKKRAGGEFDPLAYIENAFTEAQPGENGVVDVEDASVNGSTDGVNLPSFGEYLRPKGATAVAEPKSVKFRRRKLSAPRPRRVKAEAAAAPTVVDSELAQIWSAVPKNIEFLSQFFDDSVTQNYYRGGFKETREELIRRLLDPELTLEEVARLLGVCPATVRRYTNRDWLAHHRTAGGQRRFRLSGVVKFVEEHGRHPEDA